MENVLITGGAGFIGSHLADALLERGDHVVVFDALDRQVHGDGQARPSYLSADVELVRGDIRDYEALKTALLGRRIDVISHQAAAVGVGQSMYEIRRYVEINALGTANLLDILANNAQSVRKLVVASSMSIYGEGKYECSEHGVQFPRLRPEAQLAARRWEVVCPHCGRELKSLPTDESKPLLPTSVYATTKRDQEELVLEFGEAYRVPAVALRYFNVYGARQALSNPYTGVAAIFGSRLLNGRPPLVFEDGLQSRDFTHVSDIVRANLLAIDDPAADYDVFNVGTGTGTSVLEVARALAAALGVEVEPRLLGQFRVGDIRSCYADISKIRSRLGFEPRVVFDGGVELLSEWLETAAAEDLLDTAIRELDSRGLTR